MSLIVTDERDSVLDAALRLFKGSIVAFPTETVYGLGANASNEKAVNRVYTLKNRPKSHPLIVHIGDKAQITYWAEKIPDYAFALINDLWPGPLTLILNKSQNAGDFITGGNDTIALRMPDHPISQKLLMHFHSLGGNGIVGPSANKFGRVSPTTALAVMTEIGDRLSINDLILDGGQCQIGIESTILNCTGNFPIILRPGAITFEMLTNKLDGHIEIQASQISTKALQFPGSFKSHYKPEAKIILNKKPAPGTGFLALSKFKTPEGVIRLAAPNDEFEYAKILYHALRQGDKENLDTIYVFEPEEKGIGIAICDRLRKAAN